MKALARFVQEKYKDHERASEYYAKASSAGAPVFDKRFSAYELSVLQGREANVRASAPPYDAAAGTPAYIDQTAKFLEDKLGIPQDQRIRKENKPGK